MKHTRNTMLAALVLFAVGVANSPMLAQETAMHDQLSELATNEAVHEALQRPINVDFQDIEMENCVTYLMDELGVNVVADWNALMNVGVARDTPVTLRLHNVAAGKVLDEVLTLVGQPGMALAWQVDQGVLRISTAYEIQPRLVTEILDVNDLVADEDLGRQEESFQKLIDVIRDTVFGIPAGLRTPRPGTAAAVPGTVNSLGDGILVVTAEPETIERVRDLLSRIRHLRSARPETAARRVHQTGQMIRIVESMETVASNPEAVGLIAVGALRDDVAREPGEIIADLEARLLNSVSLTVRNAIRLTLRDLYRETGQNEKLLSLMRDMLKENDTAAKRTGQ